MKSVQESKNELEAAIRYAENAISSAKQTIESMEFRQEMAKKQHDERTGREQAIEEQNNHLHKEVTRLENENKELRSEVKALKEANMSLVCDNDDLKDEVEKLRKEKEASSGPCGCQAYRDIEEARGRAEGEVELLQRTISELEEKVGDLKDDLKDQREFDNEVRDAVEEFIEKLRTAGFEGA